MKVSVLSLSQRSRFQPQTNCRETHHNLIDAMQGVIDADNLFRACDTFENHNSVLNIEFGT
jgi:hypothetical protein